MAAGLAGSSLKELDLSECLICCSERCHHPDESYHFCR